MKIAKLLRNHPAFATATVAAALALAPADARAQGSDGGKDVTKYLDRKPAEPTAQKREIDITVEKADIREVMDQIGRRVGKNIVVEPEIHEEVTISLRKIPWRDAVDVIAKMAKCEVEQRGPILVLTQPPKVTIQFVDANVRTVLQLLANYSGKNIIISPEVRGEITVDLHEVHWLKALYAIVGTIPGDFAVVEDTADLLRVIPRSSIALQLKTTAISLKYLRPPAKYLATPPRTSTSQASGAATAQAAANLFVGNPKVPTGDTSAEFTLFKALKAIVDANKNTAPGSAIEYDINKNTFLIRATQPLTDELKGIIDRLDQEPSQVFVEIRFVATTDDNFLEHGIRPSGPNADNNGYQIFGPFPAGQTITNGVVSVGKVIPPLGGTVVNGDSVQSGFVTVSTPTPVGTFPFSFGTGRDRFANSFQIPSVLDWRGLQFTLNLIERDTRSRVLQSPSLFMLDNEDAVIFVGDNVPFAELRAAPDINGAIVQSIQAAAGSPIAVGFSLFISPHVVPETDKIMMTVIPRVSQPGANGLFDHFTLGSLSIDLPHTSEQALVTHIMVDDGQTAVIGGLLTEHETEIIRKTPILSSIPILGNLFTHTHHDKEVDNLLILITTTLVRTKSQSVALYKKHDDRLKANDYFYRKYEKPKVDEEARKAAEAAANNPPPPPPPPPPPTEETTPPPVEKTPPPAEKTPPPADKPAEKTPPPADKPAEKPPADAPPPK